MLAILLATIAVTPTSTAALVDAEHAFAKMAAERGVRDSFLFWFRQDAIEFGPKGPHNARKALLAAKPPKTKPTAKLAWDPICADVASSGDLGYTFGPAELKSKSDDKVIPGTSEIYLTVWKREGNGPWRVLADIGDDNPPKPADFAFRQGPIPESAKTPADQTDLYQTEKALDSHEGIALSDELQATYAKTVYQISNNVGPWSMESKFIPPSLLSFQGGAVSRNADLGYTYGTYRSNFGEHGNFIHIWRRADRRQAWKIVVDLAEPIANQ